MEIYSIFPIRQTLSSKLIWSHFVILPTEEEFKKELNLDNYVKKEDDYS